MRRLVAAMAGSLVCLAAAGAQRQDRDPTSDVAANLSFVASCRNPNTDDEVRVLVFQQGFEHVASAVYLQWLEWSEEGPRVVASVRVAELSTGVWSVAEPVMRSRKVCSIRLTASHTYASETARFDLRPAGRGRYAIRQSKR